MHHGDLAVARTLGRLGVPVYAVVADGLAPIAASRYATKSFIWKSWPRNQTGFLEAMSAIAASIGRPAIVFPMDDLSSILAAESGAELARSFVLPQVRPGLPRQLADKMLLNSLCLKVGIPVACSVVPHSMNDVFAFAKTSKFPVVLKAAQQWALLDGRFSTKIVATSDELIAFYKKLKDVSQPPSILQEYFDGEDWISHGYYNSAKRIHMTFTGRKLLGYPAAAGSTAVGLSVPNETLRRQTENLLDEISYSGIVDIDWRRDGRDGQYRILDCNPRIGQNFRMFESTTGVDVVRAQYLDLTGQSIGDTSMVAGRSFTVETFCFLAFLRGSSSTSPAGGVMKSPGPRRELAWWSRDDPLPFFVMGARFPFTLLRRAFRRFVARFTSIRRKPSGQSAN